MVLPHVREQDAPVMLESVDRHAPFDPGKVVENIDLEKAEDLVAFLDAAHDRWLPAGAWVFRGQGKASWKLVPTVLRRSPEDGLAPWERDADGGACGSR
jgi:hypothetical protein